MKITTKVLFGILLLITSNSLAQDAITAIRSQYKLYSQQVLDCKNKNEACQLYNNTYILNAGNQPWRGVGDYKKEFTFWYDDSPQHCDECGENGIESLKLVTSTTTSGLTDSYEEWVFKKGSLIFYYLKNTGEYPNEIRYYYNDGTLIRYLENGNLLDGKAALAKDKSSIKTKSSNLQKSYLLSFK